MQLTCCRCCCGIGRQALCENVDLNHVGKVVKPFNMDGREFMRCGTYLPLHTLSLFRSPILLIEDGRPMTQARYYSAISFSDRKAFKPSPLPESIFAMQPLCVCVLPLGCKQLPSHASVFAPLNVPPFFSSPARATGTWRRCGEATSRAPQTVTTS